MSNVQALNLHKEGWGTDKYAKKFIWKKLEPHRMNVISGDEYECFLYHSPIYGPVSLRLLHRDIDGVCSLGLYHDGKLVRMLTLEELYEEADKPTLEEVQKYALNKAHRLFVIERNDMSRVL